MPNDVEGATAISLLKRANLLILAAINLKSVRPISPAKSCRSPGEVADRQLSAAHRAAYVKPLHRPSVSVVAATVLGESLSLVSDPTGGRAVAVAPHLCGMAWAHAFRGKGYVTRRPSRRSPRRLSGAHSCRPFLAQGTGVGIGGTRTRGALPPRVRRRGCDNSHSRCDDAPFLCGADTWSCLLLPANLLLFPACSF